MDMNLGKLWEMVKDGSLAFCSPWGGKELDTTKWLKDDNEIFGKIIACTYNNFHSLKTYCSPYIVLSTLHVVNQISQYDLKRLVNKFAQSLRPSKWLI